jgi:hypothetical protein
MNIPKNPEILLSYINMKLRDEYSSLEALCDDLALDTDELKGKLRAIGYEYNELANQFRPM